MELMYEKPLPVVDADTRPFWEAARRHRFLIQHCLSCERYVFYPRALCPHCHSDRLEWREASGEGRTDVVGRLDERRAQLLYADNRSRWGR